MILRRFCVTVMDNWTPMRRFFTLYGARRWCAKIGVNAHLYEWTGSQCLERIFSDRWKTQADATTAQKTDMLTANLFCQASANS